MLYTNSIQLYLNTQLSDEIKKGLKTGTLARMIAINLSSQKVSKY